MKNTLTIITHDGKFHADDVFAVATLLLAHEQGFFSEKKHAEVQIIRTRDTDIIKSGDIVVDVGTIYDEATNRFDHHQTGGAGERANTIPYASFGLVWKKFGALVSGSKEVAESIDAKLVQGIDAHDNGVSLVKSLIDNVEPYFLNDFVWSFLPTWKQADEQEIFDRPFRELVNIAHDLLQREINRAQAKIEAATLVKKAYDTAEDKNIIVFDQYLPWQDVLVEYSEPLYVIYPDFEKKKWHAAVVPVKGELFKARKDFPQKWAGKRDAEFAEISGVADAVFCHNKLFLAVAQSKEGALALAKKAVTA